MAVYTNYLRDRGSKLVILAVIALITQVIFTAYVRPAAGERWRAATRARRAHTRLPAAAHAGRDHSGSGARGDHHRRDLAMILAFLRFRELKQQRELLSVGLMKQAPGVVILPSDAREYLRTLEQMPPKERELGRAARARGRPQAFQRNRQRARRVANRSTTSARARTTGSTQSSRSCGSASG